MNKEISECSEIKKKAEESGEKQDVEDRPKHVRWIDIKRKIDLTCPRT